MKTFIALDVSLEKAAICVLSADGLVLAERVVQSTPEDLAAELRHLDVMDGRALVGLEAGPLSEWIARGLEEAGAQVTLMETRHLQGGC